MLGGMLWLKMKNKTLGTAIDPVSYTHLDVYKRQIFDIVLPRLMACDMILADELAGLGEGGLCLNCDVCTFPNCGFGKGF